MRLSEIKYMENPALSHDPEILKALVTEKMPFGKFKGRRICDVPLFYLEWFHKKGFPKGRLGMQLSTIYEIKLNGLDYLLEPLKRKYCA
mgnify:CR=1 FL=1